MIDGQSTTVAWQTHTSGILVLPVGAFEQHSVHIPLDTVRGRPVVLDVPADKLALLRRLGEIGFDEQRAFVRMFRGPNNAPGERDRLYACGGPEIG